MKVTWFYYKRQTGRFAIMTKETYIKEGDKDTNSDTEVARGGAISAPAQLGFTHSWLLHVLFVPKLV